jgi:hypothetical protein
MSTQNNDEPNAKLSLLDDEELIDYEMADDLELSATSSNAISSGTTESTSEASKMVAPPVPNGLLS